MFRKAKPHVIIELFNERIRGDCPSQVKKPAQKSLFTRSFKCYREDECEGIALEVPENNEQQVTEPPIYACKFGEGDEFGHLLVLANEEGQIALRDTRQKDNVAPLEGQKIHNNAIFDVCWVPGARELVSVSGDHQALVLGLRQDGSLVHLLQLIGHTRSVKTVHVNPFDPSVIATGARDGSVIIWDKRCKAPYKADEISPAHHSLSGRTTQSPSVRKVSVGGASMANNSVTCVMFQQQHTLISSGASDGLIKLWDLRKTHGGGKREPQSQSVLEYSGRSSHQGFTSLTVSPSRDVLYTSCMDNTIYAYHLANPTPKPVAEYTGHVNLTYFVKSCISPCGSYLLSGSSDENAYIWLTDCPGKPVARLTGHFAEVTSVAWCPIDNEKLVTCADDMKLRIFRLHNSKMDDFDEKINVRGVSEQYVEHQSEETAAENAEDTSANGHASTSESRDTLPPLPVTPSTSVRWSGCAGTPSSTRARETDGSSDTPHHQSRTPRHQTPRHRHRRGRVTPSTPNTGERYTILQWLVTAKTPGSSESLGASGVAVVSDSKKASLKRKLTELIDEDQENVKKESKPKSPPSSKNILCTSADTNSFTSPSSGVAKMLKYGEDVGTRVNQNWQEKEEELTEINDCVKPIEAQDKAALQLGFRKPVTNVSSKVTDKNVGCGNASENKINMPLQLPETLTVAEKGPSSQPFRFGLLSSPTANLPNYIADGSSPHNRPETKPEKKRITDWLTTFSHMRKLKFTRTADKVGRTSAPPRHGEKKILQIKQKKKST